MMKRLLSLLLISLLFFGTFGTLVQATDVEEGVSVQAPPGNIYYVHANETGASDGNDGLSKNHTGGTNGPWATLTNAINSVQAGDTVLVYDGVYNGGFQISTGGTKANPIIFRAMSDKVLIDATGFSLGILVHNSNVRIQYVTVENFRIKGATTSDIDVSRADNITLRNNTLWGTKMGMNIVYSYHTLVENNNAFGNSEHGVYFSGGSGGTSSWCTVRNNTFHGNGWTGIQLRTGSVISDPYIRGCLVENNTIYENGWDGAAGITLSHVRDSIIRNNLLYNNLAAGFVVWGGGGFIGPKNVSIVSNTVYFKPNEGRAAFVLKNGCQDVTIKNNILISGKEYAFQYTEESLSGLEMDNNIFYRHGSEDHVFNESSSTIHNFTEWQAAEGFDPNSKVSAHTDLFVDHANDDFHLKDTSPAIDAGASAGPGIPTQDLEGNPRTDDPDTPNTGTGPIKFYDIGALEYVVQNLPDLSVEENDISFNISDPYEGDLVLLGAYVYNLGLERSPFFNVSFYDGDPAAGSLLNVSMYPPLSDQMSYAVVYGWQTTMGMNGTHDICIVIDESDQIIEEREDNNLACKELVLAERDIVPPKVISEYPGRGSIRVPIHSDIIVNFSEVMDDLVQASDIVSISPTVQGTPSWSDNRTIKFLLDGPLNFSTRYHVTIGTQARDLFGNSMVAPHLWNFTTVQEPNGPPVLVPAPNEFNVIMRENETLNFSVSIIDDGLGDLTFEWYFDYGLMNESGTNFTYWPDFDASGNHTLNLTVNDNGVPPFTSWVEWKITVIDVNRPPVITSFEPELDIWEDERVNGLIYFSVEAMDEDGDILSYHWYLDGEGKNDTTGSEFWFNFGFTSAGEHDIGLVVSDGKDIVELLWKVHINNTNRQPTIISADPVGDVKIDDRTNVTFLVAVTDLDTDDVIRMEWFVDDDLVANGLNFIYRPYKGENSTHMIKFVISDDKGGNDSKEWWLKVTPMPEVVRPPKKEDDKGLDATLLSIGILVVIVIVATVVAFIMFKKKRTGGQEGVGPHEDGSEVIEEDLGTTEKEHPDVEEGT